MSWEVFVLGVGDAFSEKYFPTAFLLRCRGHYLAIDCPDRYRAVLANLRKHTGGDHRLASIDDFLITHVHGDHMNGLEGIAFYKHFVHSTRVRLHAVPEVRAAIWDARLRGSMGALWDGTVLQPKTFDDYFEFTALQWGHGSQVGPFKITARPTRHHVPTSALLIEADGASLGYSSDTVYDPKLIDFLEPADLIIHETNLGPSHTDLACLLELPEQVRAKIRLVHYPDSFDADSPPIPALREGDVLVLGNKEG